MTGCGGVGNSEQQIDREAIKEEMEQREIKRILPAEIVEEAYRRGEILSQQASDLSLQVYQPDEQNIRELIGPEAMIKIDSLSRAEGATISWVDLTSDTAQLEEKERQLWEAYLYNVENELPLNDNVQRLGDEEYLYTRPLVLDAELMKKIPGSESPEGSNFLGMWSIRLTKKELVQSM
jgi:hypothetical protein